MKKSYYVEYYRDFGNTYNLYWLPSGEPAPAGLERITYKRAVELCKDERYRLKYDQAFSGYADTWIWPYHISAEEICDRHPLELRTSGGYVVLGL
jgi:hypothetical protein|nr:MAG TPA: hypothetical protein [Caudoviricetes sp.]